jgi:hypothetical protein
MHRPAHGSGIGATQLLTSSYRSPTERRVNVVVIPLQEIDRVDFSFAIRRHNDSDNFVDQGHFVLLFSIAR